MDARASDLVGGFRIQINKDSLVYTIGKHLISKKWVQILNSIHHLLLSSSFSLLGIHIKDQIHQTLCMTA